MRRKLRALGIGGLVVLAFGLAAVAQAQAAWFYEGTALKSGENRSFELTGTFGFTSSSGGVHCAKLNAGLDLTGGTHQGDVQTFTPEEPSQCEVSGGLVLLGGGTTKLESITLTGEPPAAINEEKVEISGIAMHYVFKNAFTLTLSSAVAPLVATPNETAEISSLALAGELNSTLSGGKVAVTGSFNVTGEASGKVGFLDQFLTFAPFLNGMEVNDCEFKKETDKCEYRFFMVGDGPGKKMEGGEWSDKKEEVEANKRYKITENCKGKELKKDKDSCAEVIEVNKLEAKTKNTWCVKLAPKRRACVDLKM